MLMGVTNIRMTPLLCSRRKPFFPRYRSEREGEGGRHLPTPPLLDPPCLESVLEQHAICLDFPTAELPREGKIADSTCPDEIACFQTIIRSRGKSVSFGSVCVLYSASFCCCIR
ncbi:hypothetical protein CEXT_197151 [Caerostris extrusa]|uniref:Uncharacterized protein n=1 Tax=Caerostris extrusa TaxID=172846 RepID=A0AAV4QUD0_CAEEX|nr:hypothetical protein CEXT_197151 [Caerostris extrusa]